MARNSNLYEILRAATTSPSDPVKAAPSPALDESPRLKDTATSVLTPPPKPAPPKADTDMVDVKARLRVEAPARVAAPPPPPNAMRPSEPMPAPATSTNPGGRVLSVTYNNAAFALLITMGVLFVAYSIGVRIGRGQAPAAEVPVVSREPEPSTVPVVTPPLFSIRLGEWPATTNELATKAQFAAGDLKNRMEKLGWKEARVITDGSGAAARVYLLYGTYENRNSDAARNTLSQLKAIKLPKDKEPTFGKSAQFVQVKR